jgi:hypothetical protein
LIDKLNEQVKQLEDTLALLDAQITAQRAETETARSTLSEAGKEMEVLSLYCEFFYLQHEGYLYGKEAAVTEVEGKFIGHFSKR